jgi:hypothetical protein
MDVKAMAAVAEVSERTAKATPGTALSLARLRPFIITNGVIDTDVASGSMSGNTFYFNLLRWFSLCSWTGKTYTDSNGTITAATPASSRTHIVVPMLFLTITSGQLTTQAGTRYTIVMTAYDEFGVALDATELVVKKTTNSKALELAIIPYVKVVDALVPKMAVMTLATHVVGTDAEARSVVAAAKTITVAITGMADDEVAQLIVPGYNTREIIDFAKAWKFNV